jgi:hypothetical protein
VGSIPPDQGTLSVTATKAITGSESEVLYRPVMGWIRVESRRLNSTRLARESASGVSIGGFFARNWVEPILEGKANEAT